MIKPVLLWSDALIFLLVTSLFLFAWQLRQNPQARKRWHSVFTSKVGLSGFMVEEDISQGRLIPLLTEYETDLQWVNVLYPHRTFLPVKVKVFIEFLQQRLANASWSVAGGELN